MNTDIRPGQVYGDNDPREPYRTLRVDAVGADGLVNCTVLTNGDGRPASRRTRIRADRLGTKHRSGYRRMPELEAS